MFIKVVVVLLLLIVVASLLGGGSRQAGRRMDARAHYLMLRVAIVLLVIGVAVAAAHLTG